MTGLAPIDAAQLPADVREAGPQAQELYSTALAFEQVLVNQLTEQLQSSVDGSGDDGDDDDSGDATSGIALGMVPGAFAQGLTHAGGIGIARQLYDSLQARGAAGSAEAAR